jgi:hypothetical protein
LPPENDNLMSQGDELELQRCAAAKMEREQGNESRQNRDHTPQRYGGGAGRSSITVLWECLPQIQNGYPTHRLIVGLMGDLCALT